MYVKEKGRITNKEYQELCEVKKRQTTDDLKELEDKEILERVGTTGRGTYYVLVLKGRQRGKRRPNPLNRKTDTDSGIYKPEWQNSNWSHQA